VPWFVVFELAYAAQHVLLVAGGAALLWLPGVRASRVARIATRAAVAGLILLVLIELSAISLYNSRTDDVLATVISSLFMLPTLLIGGGLTVAGVALLRQGHALWEGARWLPAAVLAPGVYTFVVFIPAINGPDFVARLGISGWMLLFAVLGYVLTGSRVAARDRDDDGPRMVPCPPLGPRLRHGSEGPAVAIKTVTKYLVVGGVCGLAWAASMRGWMAQLADGMPVTHSHVTWYTFVLVFLPGVLVGALLGWGLDLRRRGQAAPWWLRFAPLHGRVKTTA
jgi:hypothetical protein